MSKAWQRREKWNWVWVVFGKRKENSEIRRLQECEAGRTQALECAKDVQGAEHDKGLEQPRERMGRL